MRLGLLLGIACLAACQAPGDDSPEGAYRRFAEAANKGEDKVCFGQLTAASQEALRARLAGLAAPTTEDLPGLVFHGGRGSPIASIHLLKIERDRATVAVTARGETREVNLAREGSEWRVELPPLKGGSP